MESTLKNQKRHQHEAQFLTIQTTLKMKFCMFVKVYMVIRDRKERTVN